MTVWNIEGKRAAGKAGGGTAELPPPTSYLTNRTSEKPEDKSSDVYLVCNLCVKILLITRQRLVINDICL